MSVVRLNRNLGLRLVPKSKYFSTQPASESEEYTATPQYPPILDLSSEKKWERSREEQFEEIKKVKTVEEKQLKLNEPRYYGFRTYMFAEDYVPYDGLSLVQHVTRTHIVESAQLPDYYNNLQCEDHLAGACKDVEEAILMETEGFKRFLETRNSQLDAAAHENLLAGRIARSVNRILSNALVQEHPHLKSIETDFEPRIESSWVVGGMDPPETVKRRRNKQRLNDPCNRTVGYIGHPILALRADLPLPCVIPVSESENPALEVPVFKYDPKVLGIAVDYRHAANIPGVWPGDSSTFGLLSYYNMGHMHLRNKQLKAPDDTKEALHRQAVLSSFSWLNAQANHLGFTTYNDITYPLVTQTVLTNGQEFHFYVYQMNTLLLHYKNALENPRRNICWASGSLKLYEEVKDGKVVGLNDEVLKVLLKFYVNRPEERLGVNLRPFLSHEEKLAADYEDSDKRKWLEREYKHVMANRPRQMEIDEMYLWEKIYKVDNQTRPMEKRSRFFELFRNPARRKLSDRLPDYIPRALRPDLPRHKGRFAKDYWP